MPGIFDFHNTLVWEYEPIIGKFLSYLKILDLRVYAGPSLGILTSVGDNLCGFTEDDYKDSVW